MRSINIWFDVGLRLSMQKYMSVQHPMFSTRNEKFNIIQFHMRFQLCEKVYSILYGCPKIIFFLLFIFKLNWKIFDNVGLPHFCVKNWECVVMNLV